METLLSFRLELYFFSSCPILAEMLIRSGAFVASDLVGKAGCFLLIASSCISPHTSVVVYGDRTDEAISASRNDAQLSGSCDSIIELNN